VERIRNADKYLLDVRLAVVGGGMKGENGTDSIQR